MSILNFAPTFVSRAISARFMQICQKMRHCEIDFLPLRYETRTKLGESGAQMSWVSDKWPRARYSTKGTTPHEPLLNSPADSNRRRWRCARLLLSVRPVRRSFSCLKREKTAINWKISTRKWRAAFEWRLSGASDHRQPAMLINPPNWKQISNFERVTAESSSGAYEGHKRVLSRT